MIKQFSKSPLVNVLTMLGRRGHLSENVLINDLIRYNIAI